MSLVFYTDGSCLGNPGPGGWAVVQQGEFGNDEWGGSEEHTTNNRMELNAVLEALQRAESLGTDSPSIYTDSQYVKKGIESWLATWQKKNWKTAGGKPVKNRDLWEQLAHYAGMPVSWRWVKGHSGNPGNERANDLAMEMARAAENSPSVRSGTSGKINTGEQPLSGQQNQVKGRKNGGGQRELFPPENNDSGDHDDHKGHKGHTSTSGSGKRFPRYLSIVGGKLEQHATWAECQDRVNGVSRAKYKKCRNAAEEAKWLQSMETFLEES